MPISEGDILNLRDLEQGLENFKRVPTAEARYLDTPPELMPLDDWLAPFGHTYKMTRFLQKVLFADRCVRSLYHLAHEWFSEHPISATEPETYQIEEQGTLKLLLGARIILASIIMAVFSSIRYPYAL